MNIFRMIVLFLLIQFSLAYSPAYALDVNELPAIREPIDGKSACDIFLSHRVSTESWKELTAKDATSVNIDALYSSALTTHRTFARQINFELLKSIVADSEMTFYHQRLSLYLESIRNVGKSKKELVALFTSLLTDQVPASSIQSRINDFFSMKPGQDEFKVLKRFLGENTLEDVQELMHGGDPFHPTPESLLGKYLAETNAQTVVRKFRTSEDKTSAFNSQDRMVVALSEETLPIYKKYFNRYNFIGQYHTQNQGTLNTFFNGKYGSYGRLTYDLSFNTGVLMPHILISTHSGQLAEQYTKLAILDRYISNNPWNRFGYCLMGGYGSCTHWFANMPIGETVVNELKFPGKVDEHAGNNVPAEPQIGPTSDAWIEKMQFDGQIYTIPGSNIALSPQNLELLRKVWRNPSRMQLAEMLGSDEIAANTRGEYASPGFVALRLTAFAPQSRMPVIFYMVRDARQPIDPTFEPYINAF